MSSALYPVVSEGGKQQYINKKRIHTAHIMCTVFAFRDSYGKGEKKIKKE